MIPHNKPSLGQEEISAIQEVIQSGWIAKGEKVAEFEQAFAEYVGAKYAIAVNSGTAALYIALNIKYINCDSDKVLIPSYACAALPNAIMMSGAWYELADINQNDFNINIIPNNDVSAIIAVHTFGVPIEIKKTNCKYPYIIEDCSQALGSYINGQHVGLQGDIGIFSFGPSKMITTGSGGMIITNNKELADKAREFIDYDKNIPAFNFAMNDLQAAMGFEQLKKLPEFLKKRKEMTLEYSTISVIKGWNHQAFRFGHFSDWNHYRFVIIDECVHKLQQHLADNGITAIVPIRQDELLHNMLGMDKANFPNAEYTASHTLSLPIYPSLYDNGFDKILKALRSF